MGLRASEVAALGLDDIDWRSGEVTVCGKRARRDRLPLPADVSEAIVAYLRDGRPEGALDRTVFIRAQAPRRALTYLGITEIVAVAARRAGIPGWVHAHRLRHSGGHRVPHPASRSCRPLRSCATTPCRPRRSPPLITRQRRFHEHCAAQGPALEAPAGGGEEER